MMPLALPPPQSGSPLFQSFMWGWYSCRPFLSPVVPAPPGLVLGVVEAGVTEEILRAVGATFNPDFAVLGAEVMGILVLQTAHATKIRRGLIGKLQC